MSDENPNLPDPVPPAGAEPVPPAHAPVPPADITPQPPAQMPVPPAGATPVPPAQYPVPPAGVEPVPPQQPAYDPSQFPPQQEVPQPQPSLPPITPAAAAPSTRSGGRRPAAKKKMARKSASRAGTRPGSYRKPVKPVDSGISFMSVLMGLLGIGMLVLSIFALLPQKLTHIEGYPADDMSSKEPKNLLSAGQKILETRTEDAVFTEKEVNDYLNFRLRGDQKGAFGGFMKVKGIYVDLRPNEAEIFVERSIPLLGTTTMSSVVKSHYNDIKHQQSWKMGGGSIGRIPMKDRSLQPILNSFLRMSKVGAAELEVMNYMADVKIGNDQITLDSAL
ncbi:MAG: hypothetical protein P1U89_27010 [Verrucomicrobiales bacterium]|nr:hypothetical protein [Verrucomicrobiales bacterium]